MAWCGRSASGKMGEKIPLNKNKYIKNQTKWLIGVVVVAALGSLAYLGTSTDLFKGSLRGEKSGLPAVTEAQCNKLQEWDNQGVLSNKMKNAYPYQLACIKQYGKLLPTWITSDTCRSLLANWKGKSLPLPPHPPATMGPDYPEGSSEYICSLKYPAEWK